MSHPRIEEVSDSDPDVVSDPDEGDIDDFVDSDIMRRMPDPAQLQKQQAAAASAAQAQAQAAASANLPSGTMAPDAPDRAEYNDFQCLYPVYFDATRSRAEGRRVSSSLAVKNPLAREIATACSRLRLPTLLEPEKTHPKDWANPGRVKVGLKKSKDSSSGAAENISNKHHLYVLIAQHLKQNPTTESSAGLRVRIGGQVQPAEGKPYPTPAVPRGWKMGEYVPYLSPAMTGGGVSENLFKDMMKEMQGGGNPMEALMASAGAGAATGGDDSASSSGGKKKKDKKGKGRG